MNPKNGRVGVCRFDLLVDSVMLELGLGGVNGMGGHGICLGIGAGAGVEGG